MKDSLKRLLLTSSVVSVSLAAGCGTATSDESVRSASTAPASSETAEAEEVAEIAPELPYVACDDLIKSGWKAPANGELSDVTWEPQTGEAVFTFGEERTRVNIETDPACVEVPDLARYIVDIKEDFEVNRASECEALVEQLEENSFPEKNGKKPSAEDVRAHLLSFCDQEFLDTLPSEILKG